MKNPYLEHGMSNAEKKAYNHKYYEEHKFMWGVNKRREHYPKSYVADRYGPNRVINPSRVYEAQISDADRARMSSNKRYYNSAMNSEGHPTKWTLSPEYDQKNKLSRPGQNAIAYTVDKDPEHDPYRYIDSNIRYKQESDFYNTPESFSSDSAKRFYKRSQAYADNEIAKTLKQYEKIRDQYTLKNDIKLAAAKGKNAVIRAAKNAKLNWKNGAREIQSYASRGADALSKLFKRS